MLTVVSMSPIGTSTSRFAVIDVTRRRGGRRSRHPTAWSSLSVDRRPLTFARCALRNLPACAAPWPPPPRQAHSTSRPASPRPVAHSAH